VFIIVAQSTLQCCKDPHIKYIWCHCVNLYRTKAAWGL